MRISPLGLAHFSSEILTLYSSEYTVWPSVKASPSRRESSPNSAPLSRSPLQSYCQLIPYCTKLLLRACIQTMPDQVRCRHLLVKHEGSRRPSSWKSDRIVRNKEQALELLAGYRQSIISGQTTFEQLARTESDCSSASSGGDLGYFGLGQMQKPFEDVAFGLDIGEISGYVDTDSGVHIIQRIE